MHNCILQVLVHGNCIPNALCMLQDCCNNIPNCDCEHGISYYSTYRSWLYFSDIDCFGMDLVSSRFCWVICSLSFYPYQCISWVYGFHNLPSFVIVWLQLYLCLELGTWNLDPDTCQYGHVFTTAKLVQN